MVGRMEATLRIGESLVTFHGETVRLTEQEKALLLILYRMRGEVVSRAEIFDCLYGDFDILPQPKILDVLICKIRQKLARIDEQHGIETFPGTGYGYLVGTKTEGEKTLAKTFHHKMMRELDNAQMNGREIPKHVHRAMRQALRKAQMRGAAIQSERELAKATFDQLARG